jgi:hypothetical protein
MWSWWMVKDVKVGALWQSTCSEGCVCVWHRAVKGKAMINPIWLRIRDHRAGGRLSSLSHCHVNTQQLTNRQNGRGAVKADWADDLLLPYLSVLAVSIHHVPDWEVGRQSDCRSSSTIATVCHHAVAAVATAIALITPSPSASTSTTWSSSTGGMRGRGAWPSLPA